MEPLWTPASQQIEDAAVTAFLNAVNDAHGLALKGWDELYRWSVDNPAEFWEAVWCFCGVKASREWDEVLTNREAMPGAKWFTGARLNYAENLLYKRDDTEAIVFWGEEGVQQRLTWDELWRLTAHAARALKQAGVGPGDRVAGFMPNIPETVAAMLAAASIGAVWSSCSPDFGVGGVLDRFGQIEPKVLFTADGYRYGGKTHDSLERVRSIIDQLPSIEKVVVVPFIDEAPDLNGIAGAVAWPEFLGADDDPQLEFAQLPFDHPLFVMYSSGTTGLPKCMVHSAGGTLLQHLKEHQLHCDISEGDRVFYYTTCGWMMWNWLVSALASGATIMLYDGAPFHPKKTLWHYAERERINVFGTSAKYISAMEKEGLRPVRTHDLPQLNSILSTGSPLSEESFDYVYREIKKDVRLSSISGGTDIISCFALGCPVLPVFRGELQCRGLGMKVEVWDDEGRPVTGEKGELVCSAPFPSMPTGFWNDEDGSKYRVAYFENWPGVWAHGDYVELRQTGGMVFYGRSDAVLNPGGVRIGTAEIYRVVEAFDEVVESICVGQDWQDDVRVVLFVVLRDGLSLDDELRDRIRKQIRAEKTPRHVPAKIIQVEGIPRTISGKIVELAVRETIHGRPVKNADALKNPEALEFFRDLDELRG